MASSCKGVTVVRKLVCCLIPTLLVTAACGPSATEDALAITFGSGAGAPPVQVDVDCLNGGCESIEELAGELTYSDEEATAVDAEVEILQYRIDYALAAPHDDVDLPYFAGHVALTVKVGETVGFNVVAAGEKQRQFILARYPDDQLRGTATLTLAGYDQQNEQVFPRADFDIYFDDFVAEVAP